MSTPLAITLLGSRFMGRAHANAWSRVGAVFDVDLPRLYTVAARDPQELASFAARWRWERWSTDWRSAVDDPETDLVDVATPNHLHAEQSIAALEAGKHVVCEKPLAGTLADAESMARAAASAAGRAFVWFNYRRLPAVAFAHQLVQRGFLGRIYHVRACYLQSWGGPETPLLWRFDGEQAGSGAHGDLNAHLVDAVRFLTGEELVTIAGAVERTFITERTVISGPSAGGISATSASGGAATAPSTVDDAVLFLAHLSGGGIASFEATRLATGYHNANRIELHGEHGALRFDLERINELGLYRTDVPAGEQGWTTVDVTRADDGHPYLEAWWPASHGLGYEHGFVNQAADVLRVLAGGEPVVPLPDFADALRTQRVLDAALRSARERAPIALDD